MRVDRLAGRSTLCAVLSLVILLTSTPTANAEPELWRQTADAAAQKSHGCLSCHAGVEKMHLSSAVKLGCTDCHGGDAAAAILAGGDIHDEAVKSQAHVAPRYPERWPSSANPERSFTLLTDESAEFVRFINPGDLRVAQETCGGCHQEQVTATAKSTMTTSSIFWAAAAYANGILPFKTAITGESYSRDGEPQKLLQTAPLSDGKKARGALDFLFPLPKWHGVPPGEYFRAFERGGLFQPAIFPEIGNPNPLEDPGRPDIRVSDRGRGTGARVSPAVINLHKTRLNDPHLSHLGTNDHPGDYRSSGCSACHVMYANDRDPVHSGPWAEFGHRGESATGDKTVPRGEGGHPIQHRFTRSIATSQCMSCHMHQPNSFVNTYLGYTMWDYETDAELMWPKEQRYPTAEERRASLDHNPEGAAARGLWTDRDFLEKVSELNPRAEHTQFADYHGHGWIFRAIFSRDREGRLLDDQGNVVSFDDPEKFEKAVHLRDIHLEGGMHCVDCHFSRDSHGTGNLHGGYADAIEIECQDCHGDTDRRTDLRSSGPAAPRGGTDFSLAMTPFGQRRFVWRDGRLFQRGAVTEGLEWEVKQVVDTVTEGHANYNERSAYAKTVRRDGTTWGIPKLQPEPPGQGSAGGARNASRPSGLGRAPSSPPGRGAVAGLPANDTFAHSSDDMTCYSCHSSWITACFGCHLPQEANQRSEVNHYEGGVQRNYASYNPQVIRTDAYMLGKSSAAKGNKVAPVRSSSALVLSSVNMNRQRIYLQQPPISAPGFSSQAFNPHVPHTVRSRETKQCSDCHLSEGNDNNAWLAQLLLLGTNTVNFIGRYAYVGLGDHGFEAVEVTEWDEPQAVIGSYLHRIAYPDNHAEHRARGDKLRLSHHHHGEVVSLQLRGEYLFTAGAHGLEVFDVANVDNKDFSERLVTAPVSPLGQNTRVKTQDATAVALATNMPVSPDGVFFKEEEHRRRMREEYGESPMHDIYRYAVVSDRREGLVLADITTLTNGEPRDNFFERACDFNPDGTLDGAESVTLAGHLAYVGAARGLTVVDLDLPCEPRILATLAEVRGAAAISVQFRYAFAIDQEGLAVIDITFPEKPRLAARLEIDEAHGLYLARTYAYIAAGSQGLVIVDVKNPEKPRLDQMWNAEGRLTDSRDVKVASTNASLFAYVADGANGIAVVQLISPETVPGYLGFAPRPMPRLIAHYPTHGPAIALSKGLDRDRAVDETGHQVSIFNRVGARPFTLEEMQRLYLRDGEIYRVSDTPPRSAEEKTP